MNPIKWLFNDLKGDINFIKSVLDGTYKLPKHLKGMTFKKVVYETLTWKFAYVVIALCIIAVIVYFYKKNYF